MKLEETEDIVINGETESVELVAENVMLDVDTEVSESAAATFKDIQLYRSYAEKCVMQNKDFETFSEFRYPTF